jgi:hypothetical protein
LDRAAGSPETESEDIRDRMAARKKALRRVRERARK